jgi:hypothetical protein
VIIVIASAGRYAQIIVPTKIDIIVGRIAICIDVLDVFQIAQILIPAKIEICLGIHLLFFLKGQGLLGLEDRLGRPDVAAFNAGDRIVFAKIIEPRPAPGAGTLGTPFGLCHPISSKLASPLPGTGETLQKQPML